MSFLEVIQTYIIGALKSTGHLSVIVFSLLIGGMVAIISKNGEMAGVVKSLSKYAKVCRFAVGRKHKRNNYQNISRLQIRRHYFNRRWEYQDYKF